jgi:hypothetical protein
MPVRTPANACPVFGCKGVRANTGMVMCGRCWRRVPKLLKNAVWDAFRAWERDPSLASIFALRCAHKNAIRAVERQNTEAA